MLKFQRVQNTLARIVLQSGRFDHSTTMLNQLHWLPIHSRIRFKIATLTYKALSTGDPAYLANLLHPTRPTYNTRSSSQSLLQPVHTSLKFGSRAFRSAAPTVWNAIPLNIRTSPSLPAFKRNLKTYFFRHPPA